MIISSYCLFNAKISVETATLKEAAAITKIVNESFQAMGRGFYRIPGSNRIELEKVKGMIQDSDKYRVYVCLRKNDDDEPEVIGASYVDIHDSEFCMFAVAVGYEKNGIGSKILEHVEKNAKEILHLDELKLDIVNDKRELYLKKFYEKRGFIFSGTGTCTDPKQFEYHGGEQIVEDIKTQQTPRDTIPLVLFSKKL